MNNKQKRLHKETQIVKINKESKLKKRKQTNTNNAKIKNQQTLNPKP